MKHTVKADAYRFVTFKVDRELLGIRVDQVQEVLTERSIAPVPLAPPEIAGFLNLRGQIVTTIDLRLRLGIPPRKEGERSIHVIVKEEDELISLVVDTVGDVLQFDAQDRVPTPATLDALWSEYCEGIFKMERGLLVMLDVKKVLDIHMVDCF